ncbi:MAG TPA: bacteriohopanetetrol glucosamine biosynthesis glycosyltransferase HpnI [Steroidobacteraceae bacterium]|jgi:ceramide glucosyltransferase|nr:bacteriohopanetetrol glucosamine biosynthesis glycosyltransferase HpnI [Steroidobacteraceae bacterium]
MALRLAHVSDLAVRFIDEDERIGTVHSIIIHQQAPPSPRMIPAPETATPALSPILGVLGWVGLVLAALAALYTFVALAGALLRPRRRAHWPRAVALPGVTILKPLCGAEPRLYECLHSFCNQAWPQLQIVFGVRDPADPAVAVVRRLQHEFPALDLTLVLDGTYHGSNGKVSNLINIVAVAKHDYLIIVDSDIRVEPGYVQQVVAPLLDASVGIVTCPYVGRPLPDMWSQLGAQFINGWFVPSVFVAALFGSRAFAFGATIGLRRQVLEAIGGLPAIADQLADDYRLGELTRELGLRTVLSEVVVETVVEERSLQDLFGHELRWLRTIKAVRPWGYSLAFVSFAFPVALIGAALARGTRLALLLLGATALLRLVMHFYWSAAGDRSTWTRLWAVPLHDCSLLGVWCWAFLGQRVHWGKNSFHLAEDGSVSPLAAPLENE